jgi:hypothetical protein
MKSIAILCLSLLLIIVACNNDTKTRALEIAKAAKQKELVFNSINKAWIFIPRDLSPESQSIVNNWNEWRLFIYELNQKPNGTIGAFQRKTKILIQKSDLLTTTIPEIINKPQVRSRLMALITKLKALYTFINLDQIPERKVILFISDLNIEINAFQDQIEEIVQRRHIQKEEGEAEMLNSIKDIGSASSSAKPEETKEQTEIK